MGNDPADDVADPIGGPRSGYERTAVELEQLALSVAGAARARAVAVAPVATTAAPGADPTSPLRPFQET